MFHNLHTLGQYCVYEYVEMNFFSDRGRDQNFGDHTEKY